MRECNKGNDLDEGWREDVLGKRFSEGFFEEKKFDVGLERYYS